MKREDICTIVKDVASQFGYEYRDHLGLIYLTKEDDEIEVCCCHELPQSINLFSRVFDFDPSFTSDDIINLISQMNTRSEFCSFLICEDLDKRDEEPLPIIVKSDLYALSKSHLRKSLPIVLTKMIKERDFYIQCCKDAMDAVNLQNN